MRKAREILRLKHELGLTNRQIGASLHLSHVSVGKYLQRAGEAGVASSRARTRSRQDFVGVISLPAGMMATGQRGSHTAGRVGRTTTTAITTAPAPAAIARAWDQP